MSDMKYGPQTYQIEKIIEKLRTLTPEQIKDLDAAQGAAWSAAQGAAWDAAWDAAQGAVWDAAWSAVAALLVRDLVGKTFTQTHYDLLTKPWREIMGEFEEPEPTPTLQQQIAEAILASCDWNGKSGGHCSFLVYIGVGVYKHHKVCSHERDAEIARNFGKEGK